MFCKDCGKELADTNVKFCDGCGKALQVKDAPFAWVPLVVTVIAFFIFGALGGDPAISEVNVFDYVTGIMSAISLALVFVLIPKERKGWFITSIVLSSYMIFSAFAYILGNVF